MFGVNFLNRWSPSYQIICIYQVIQTTKTGIQQQLSWSRFNNLSKSHWPLYSIHLKFLKRNRSSAISKQALNQRTLDLPKGWISCAKFINGQWNLKAHMSHIIIITVLADVLHYFLHGTVWRWPWPRFNIKMSCQLNRNSHCWDKTVTRLSYLHNGNSYTDKMESLVWVSPLGCIKWKCSHI